jgi:hypothetical protein
MLRFITSIPRYINKSQMFSYKRQLSTTQRLVKNKFTWKLMCLGAISSGFYFIYISIQNGYTAERKKKVIVLGSGWAAVNFIRNLKPELYELSIVSPANYFLFTPLLPSVTVGTVEVRSVVEPIRNLIHKKHKNTVNFYEGECIDVDIENQTIRCKDNSGIIYLNSNRMFSCNAIYLCHNITNMLTDRQIAWSNLQGLLTSWLFNRRQKRLQYSPSY